MAAHSSPQESKILQIGIEYDDDDDVEGIVSCLARRTEMGLPRRGPVADQAPLILAGGISSQLLAVGLVKWLRSLKDISIYVEIRAKSDVFRIFKGKTPGVTEIVVMRPDGREERRGASAEPEDVAVVIEDAPE